MRIVPGFDRRKEGTDYHQIVQAEAAPGTCWK